jgi:hypothetical protein
VTSLAEVLGADSSFHIGGCPANSFCLVRNLCCPDVCTILHPESFPGPWGSWLISVSGSRSSDLRPAQRRHPTAGLWLHSLSHPEAFLDDDNYPHHYPSSKDHPVLPSRKPVDHPHYLSPGPGQRRCARAARLCRCPAWSRGLRYVRRDC